MDKDDKITRLLPRPIRKNLPDTKAAKAAGLSKAEEIVAIIRGHIKPPGKDEPLYDDDNSGPDMSASRRITDPDGKLVGIGSLREIQERALAKARKAIL